MKYFARVVLVNQEGKFLMQHTTKEGRNRWEFPGGKVETGESYTTAAIRETFEEVGVVPYLLESVCVKRINIDGEDWKGYFFTTTFWKGEPHIMEPTKADEVRWVNVREMADLPSIPALSVDIAREIYG